MAACETNRAAAMGCGAIAGDGRLLYKPLTRMRHLVAGFCDRQSATWTAGVERPSGKANIGMISGVISALSGNAAKGVALAAVVASLSACMGSPTYGTDKPADVQLLEDVTGVLTISPKNEAPIEYKPRPELVKPVSTAQLPPPQDSINTASNPAWPESPGQRRARVRAEATINRDDVNFQPEVYDEVARAAPRRTFRRTRGDDLGANGNTLLEGSGGDQRKEFNRRLAANTQGSPTSRRYLSEPPLDYRQPAATAPAGDIGEDEWRKEKRREVDSKKSWSLRNLIPWG